MNEVQLREFRSNFCDVLGDSLAQYGYKLNEDYSRPRGVVLEFTLENHILFAVWEGGTVILDLILYERADRYWRVSINQVLWYSGIRAVAKNASLTDQLALFANEMPKYCGDFLAGNLSLLDTRYCYQMSVQGRDQYLEIQRGHVEKSRKISRGNSPDTHPKPPINKKHLP